ncbi:putative Ig domain-containing protein [Nocardioides acrostichi]|uniref:Ig domain-containing protein n=1 Tax=Nocardioides acrostichi TaxID=2784339 RepID=A0A930Y6Z9_9ACTN|nr:putative Ig domain-containing protein [Nocardioides acrostichi]MBF4161527.1 putative Ig domain-containing protein [Nocardioides acrostichi]
MRRGSAAGLLALALTGTLLSACRDDDPQASQRDRSPASSRAPTVHEGRRADRPLRKKAIPHPVQRGELTLSRTSLAWGDDLAFEVTLPAKERPVQLLVGTDRGPVAVLRGRTDGRGRWRGDLSVPSGFTGPISLLARTVRPLGSTKPALQTPPVMTSVSASSASIQTGSIDVSRSFAGNQLITGQVVFADAASGARARLEVLRDGVWTPTTRAAPVALDENGWGTLPGFDRGCHEPSAQTRACEAGAWLVRGALLDDGRVVATTPAAVATQPDYTVLPVVRPGTLPRARVGRRLDVELHTTPALPGTWRLLPAASLSDSTRDSTPVAAWARITRDGHLTGTPRTAGRQRLLVQFTPRNGRPVLVSRRLGVAAAKAAAPSAGGSPTASAGSAPSPSDTATEPPVADVEHVDADYYCLLGLAVRSALRMDTATPLRWTLTSGALPPGLELDGASAVVSGAPQHPGAPRLVRLDGRDDAGEVLARRTVRLPACTSSPAPVVQLRQLPVGRVDEGYAGRVVAPLRVERGRTSVTVPRDGTWRVALGSLPPGLRLSPDGVITGQPTKAGAFSVTVRFTESGTGRIATRPLVVTVLP